ncbi:MAG: hypothetical protein KAS72_14855, partial [Phycisphaerales bacterium]|nr:hypothetical protein [Phycisphaerales bacterium]
MSKHMMRGSDGRICRTRKAAVTAFVALVSLLIAAPDTANAAAGSIVGWGSQVVGVDLSGGFVSVAAGNYHNLGLKDDGS